MESLQQLLEDGMSISRVSNYSDKEKLTLCYILANSMIFLYPGSWLRTAWNSNKVYFIRRAGVSALKPELYDFEPRIKYKSWVDGHAEWRDDVGHGTHLAILLRKVAPNAEIHMARVFKSRPKGDKSALIIAEFYIKKFRTRPEKAC
ncbi:Subtilisin DY [Colletotrichum sp. SAR11_59]|nr:Subtilisin DY [Colletotrichum sp. SAR11_59]